MNEERKSGKKDLRFWCFDNADEQEAIEESVNQLLNQTQNQYREKFINERNVLRMNHGGAFVHSSSDSTSSTSSHSISVEWKIPFKDIADNDLNLIDRTLTPISEEMKRQFARNIYDVAGAAAEAAGNVVDAKKYDSLARVFLESFRKIELAVDRDGNVSMPEIHVGSGMAERISKEMNSIPPEIEREMEALKAEKTAAALARESERKSKFKQKSK